MSRSLTHSAVALIAAFLIVVPVAAPAAFAQQAITLETIGAVRMAAPDELRGRDAALDTAFDTTDRGRQHGADLTGSNQATAR